jgi:integrase
MQRKISEAKTTGQFQIKERKTMIYKRGRNYTYKFVLYGERVRRTTKQGDAVLARTLEADCLKELVAAVGSVATTEEGGQKLRAYLARAKTEAKQAKTEAVPSPPPITFRAQAKIWIDSLSVRRRRPVKPATIAGWQHALDKWVNPHLGDRPLCEVGNGALRDLITEMYAVEPKLTPKTIVNYTAVVKLVVASAVDAEGNRLHPIVWNHEFVQMPVVDSTMQERQTVTQTEVEQILKKVKRRYGVLLALLAGSGLRIGEALALKPRDFSEDRRVLRVTRSIWDGEEQEPKTKNAVRDVDLAEPLARLIRAHISALEKFEYIFKTSSGRPLSQRNVLRALHLTEKKVGLHAFRRFRTETLRRAPAPPDLVTMWLGHASKTVTDDYAKGLREDLAWRQKECDRVGLGFSLDALVGPQSVEQTEAA